MPQSLCELVLPVMTVASGCPNIEQNQDVGVNNLASGCNGIPNYITFRSWKFGVTGNEFNDQSQI